METLFQDIRYALRMLAKAPTFAITAITVLALGIGANTAVFSLVDTVLLRPLPFPEPQRLMSIGLVDPKVGEHDSFGDADFVAVRDQQRSFAYVAAYGLGQGGFSFSSSGEPQRVRG